MVLFCCLGNAMSSDDVTQFSSEESSVLRAQGEKLSGSAFVSRFFSAGVSVCPGPSVEPVWCRLMLLRLIPLQIRPDRRTELCTATVFSNRMNLDFIMILVLHTASNHTLSANTHLKVLICNFLGVNKVQRCALGPAVLLCVRIRARDSHWNVHNETVQRKTIDHNGFDVLFCVIRCI